ncbi:MAG: hypothetical protein J6D28_00035 [Bacilli bacterium]|nr:hypothetical protein [Bacilli bacterium]
MNYYMPFTPYISAPAKTGLLSGIFKNGINWGSILTNTQKTLNIINQTIPVIKQVKPVIGNAKTMFKVMNEFKKVQTPVTELKKNPVKQDTLKAEEKIIVSNNNPTFFL